MKSFIGSTVAMIVGAVSFFGQLTHLSAGVNMDNMVGGITAIFGAAAYQLAKRRKLVPEANSGGNRTLEFILLGIVCTMPVAQTISGVDFVTRPWSNLLIPIWSIAAYLWVRYRKPAQTVSFR